MARSRQLHGNQPSQTLQVHPGGTQMHFWWKHNKKLMNAGDLRLDRVVVDTMRRKRIWIRRCDESVFDFPVAVSSYHFFPMGKAFEE